MSNAESTTCPVLTGLDNFHIWKIRITAKLQQEEVWDVVTTSPSSPETSSEALTTYPSTTIQHTDSWSVRDWKAAGIIIAYVSDRLAIEVGNLEHAKEMFEKLVKIHEDTNVTVSAFYTFTSMLHRKWDGSPSTLSDHIAAISAADAKLTAMKKQIDREFLAYILLQTLPEDNKWESFRATVLNSLAPGESLSFSQVVDYLTFTAAAQRGTSSNAALKANTSSKHKSKTKSDKWCEHHKSITHNTSECWSLKEKKDRKEKVKKKDEIKGKGKLC